MVIEVWSRPLVHCYDVEQHRIVCGFAEQIGSTKHVGGVTCPKCLQLLSGDDDSGGGGSVRAEPAIV